MKRFYVLALAAIVLAACAPSAPVGSPPAAQPTSNLSPLSLLPSPTAPSAPTEPVVTIPAGPTGRATVSPDATIVYQLEGGIAGGSKQWTFYPTGRIVAWNGIEWQVPSDQVKTLFDLAESPAYWNLNDIYPTGVGCNDCYVPSLTVFRKGEVKKVTFSAEGKLPAVLQQMLDEINKLITR